MIVSHKHKFIFLKTLKTAGTSVELSLSRFLGKDDILTPLSEDSEKLRPKEAPEAKNYNIRNQSLTAHTHGRKIKKLILPALWDIYFKFTIERIPTYRLLSLYHYSKYRNHIPDISFEDFIFNPNWESLRRRNQKIYKQNNELLVDHIIDFHDLPESLYNVCSQIGIEFDGWLPRAKTGFKKDESLLTPPIIKQIEKEHDDVYQLMNYTKTTDT